MDAAKKNTHQVLKDAHQVKIFLHGIYLITVGWTAQRQWVGYISLNFSAAWSSYCCCKRMSSFFSSAVFCSVPGCP